MNIKQQLEQVIAEMRDYARQTWSHDAEDWASRLSAIVEQMPSASAICNISSFSSRMCEYGTKGCTTQHAAPPVPEGMVLVPEVLLRQIAKWLAESADPYDKAAYAINGLIAAAKEEG